MKKEITITKMYCDMCEKEITDKRNIKPFKIELFPERCSLKFEDICKQCLRDKIVPFIQTFQSTAKLDFALKGSCEQGGEQCPVCGHINNAYTYKGKCEYCGFEKVEVEE